MDFLITITGKSLIIPKAKIAFETRSLKKIRLANPIENKDIELQAKERLVFKRFIPNFN